MVRYAELPIAESASDRDDVHIHAVIARIVANLFEAPERREIGYGISKYGVPYESHPDSDGGHILFGHARVQELFGEPFAKLIQNSKSEISRDEKNLRVTFGEQCELCDKG